MSNNSDRKPFSDLREKAEKKINRSANTSQTNKLQELEHELSVHEVELMMQNEELLETQAQLKSVLKEFKDLFEFSPSGYFILDINGVIKNTNEIACVQFGVSKLKLINQYFSVFIDGETDQDNFYRYRNHVIQTSDTLNFTCEIKRKDETQFSSLIKSTIIKDEQNNFKYLLLLVSDISEIKEHERQIQLALTKAEELNEMKSRFITLASHEFRTPLTVILSSTNLAEQNALSGKEEKMQKHLERIRITINELTMMLDEFLSLEKIENGAIKIIKSTFNLQEFCQEITEDFAVLMKDDQYIDYKHFGEKHIKADLKIIQNIILYILSNASKFSNEDEVINFSTEVENNKVTILIKDHGIGIPENEQKNIFTQFFRAKNAVNIKGAGLKLHIVKRYLELMNGTIDFTSEVNKGTTFRIQFPIND
jgi:two-component system sensor kinase FixL